MEAVVKWLELALRSLVVALAAASVGFLAFLSAGLLESRLNNVGPIHVGVYIALYWGGVAILAAVLIATVRKSLVVSLLASGCVIASAYVLVLLLAAAII